MWASGVSIEGNHFANRSHWPLATGNFGIGDALETPFDIGGREVATIMPFHTGPQVEPELRCIRRKLPALSQGQTSGRAGRAVKAYVLVDTAGHATSNRPRWLLVLCSAHRLLDERADPLLIGRVNSVARGAARP